ncbi:alpha/beta hydrolase fold-domain-containing protein [Sporodiniella umbellata]|nr:alpha/beta hydrolase fold-domain-containing protein [Sporodiniella umbellata]
MSDISKEDRRIEMNGIQVNLSILRPSGSEKEILPVILFAHGGGWGLYQYNSYHKLVSEMVRRTHACLVYIDFSPSPKAKHLIAIEECYSTLSWVQENAKAMNLDASRIAFCGDSTGGNLAIVTTLLAKQKGNMGITQNVLFYPVTDSDFDTPSYLHYKDNMVLNRATMIQIFENYIRDSRDLQSTLVAPYKNSIQTISKLPSTLVISAEIDLLKSDGEKYVEKLKEAGVATTHLCYPKTVHGFISNDIPALHPKALDAIQKSADWLKNEWETKAKL